MYVQLFRDEDFFFFNVHIHVSKKYNKKFLSFKQPKTTNSFVLFWYFH